MKRVYSHLKNITAGIVLLTLTLAVNADESGGLLPPLAKAKGEQCVEPTDVMRRNHFEYILHQRDQTLYQGIRASKYSLVECIDCHVLPDENNAYVSHDESEHFCTTCHEVAAVKIDCFECHSDRPVDMSQRHNGGSMGKSAKFNADKSRISSTLTIQNSLKTLQAKK